MTADRHLKSMTSHQNPPPVNRCTFEEQLRQISSRSDLKARSLRLFGSDWRAIALARRRIRWVAMWDQFLLWKVLTTTVLPRSCSNSSAYWPWAKTTWRREHYDWPHWTTPH